MLLTAMEVATITAAASNSLKEGTLAIVPHIPRLAMLQLLEVTTIPKPEAQLIFKQHSSSFWHRPLLGSAFSSSSQDAALRVVGYHLLLLLLLLQVLLQYLGLGRRADCAVGVNAASGSTSCNCAIANAATTTNHAVATEIERRRRRLDIVIESPSLGHMLHANWVVLVVVLNITVASLIVSAFIVAEVLPVLLVGLHIAQLELELTRLL